MRKTKFMALLLCVTMILSGCGSMNNTTKGGLLRCGIRCHGNISAAATADQQGSVKYHYQRQCGIFSHIEPPFI